MTELENKSFNSRPKPEEVARARQIISKSGKAPHSPEQLASIAGAHVTVARETVFQKEAHDRTAVEMPKTPLVSALERLAGGVIGLFSIAPLYATGITLIDEAKLPSLRGMGLTAAVGADRTGRATADGLVCDAAGGGEDAARTGAGEAAARLPGKTIKRLISYRFLSVRGLVTAPL